MIYYMEKKIEKKEESLDLEKLNLSRRGCRKGEVEKFEGRDGELG